MIKFSTWQRKDTSIRGTPSMVAKMAEKEDTKSSNVEMITQENNIEENKIGKELHNSNQPYKFGFSLEDAYKQSLLFYRKAQSAVHLSYADKLQLMAYWKQESCGKCDNAKLSDLGYLDVIGNDRRKAWQLLGDLSREDSMKRFCELLEKIFPEYTAHMEAQQKDAEEKERLRLEEIERQKQEEECRRLEEERVAEQQRLQEEQQRMAEQEATMVNNVPHIDNHIPQTQTEEQLAEENTEKSTMLAKASLWTRPKLQEFIQHVKRDASSFLVVGRGETVTIRVPTHENGSCLFWEFGTEMYDIGFGVYFEANQQELPNRNITVHVDESDVSDDDDENISKHQQSTTTETTPSGSTLPSNTQKQLIEILPVLRRNSHNDVIVGSHVYPGQGIYLLKYDNSYSLFRSKSLYYRVYYTK